MQVARLILYSRPWRKRSARDGCRGSRLSTYSPPFAKTRRKTRYANHAEVLDYCRRSANPVGRLVLHLAGCHDRVDVPLADDVCTGLQLVNFCQDVAADFHRGRIYLPQDACRGVGYNEENFAAKRYDQAFVQLLAGEVDRAADLLRSGEALMEQTPAWLSRDVFLFMHGGLAACNAVRNINYNVWPGRPRIGKWTQLKLMWRALRLPRRR